MCKKYIVLDENIQALLVQGSPTDKIAEHISKEYRKAMKAAGTSFIHKTERVFGYALKINNE